MADETPEEVGPPSENEVEAYLDRHFPGVTGEIRSALRAEKAAQDSVCNVPAEDAVWPSDLREALCRRVAHNLAMRALPLAVQATASETAVATTRIGGNDPEVRRFEAPYRKRPLA